MNAISPRSGMALLTAAISACAWAGGDAPARMIPDPPNVRSIYSPGEGKPAAVAERTVVTDNGVTRVRDGVSEAAAGSNGNPPASAVVQGGAGQAIRVVPGAQPDLTRPAASMAMPADVVFVESGGAKMLRRPGMADDLPSAPPQSQAAPPAKPPPGMMIVDLPAGAVAPVGMPEPRTLYRVTSSPLPAVPPEATRAPN